MTYLFAALFVLWLVLFLYLIRLLKQQQVMMKEFRRLEKLMEEKRFNPNPEQTPQSR